MLSNFERRTKISESGITCFNALSEERQIPLLFSHVNWKRSLEGNREEQKELLSERKGP
jgi:hypothetical protein